MRSRTRGGEKSKYATATAMAMALALIGTLERNRRDTRAKVRQLTRPAADCRLATLFGPFDRERKINKRNKKSNSAGGCAAAMALIRYGPWCCATLFLLQSVSRCDFNIMCFGCFLIFPEGAFFDRVVRHRACTAPRVPRARSDPAGDAGAACAPLSPARATCSARAAAAAGALLDLAGAASVTRALLKVSE